MHDDALTEELVSVRAASDRPERFRVTTERVAHEQDGRADVPHPLYGLDIVQRVLQDRQATLCAAAPLDRVTSEEDAGTLPPEADRSLSVTRCVQDVQPDILAKIDDVTIGEYAVHADFATQQLQRHRLLCSPHLLETQHAVELEHVLGHTLIRRR